MCDEGGVSALLAEILTPPSKNKRKTQRKAERARLDGTWEGEGGEGGGDDSREEGEEVAVSSMDVPLIEEPPPPLLQSKPSRPGSGE